MFVPIAEAARQSLEKLLDELVSVALELPEGETKRRMSAQIVRLEEALMAYQT